MRALGLDYGARTIGLAVSDPLNIAALGLETIRRPDECALKKSVARIGEIIKRYDVGTIVLGYPKRLDNSVSERCVKTLEFKERLQRNFKKTDIVLWDERFSTRAAGNELKMAGFDKKKIAGEIDMLAAVIILQTYLDATGTMRRMDENSGLKTISMFDTQTGAETVMVVADTAVFGGVKYLLVYDSEHIKDDEAEASVLKEVNESENDFYYEPVTDGAELESVAGLFGGADGYELEL